MTIVSRILGFVRDMIIARIFGADSGTDAFFVAFKIPNFLRRLFAEGAFSHALVPVLSEIDGKRGRKALQLFIDRVGGVLALIFLAASVVGMVAAPVFILLFAPGFLAEAGRFGLAVELLRITFPYLFFISCTAFAGGILNAFGKFAVPAFTPALLNLSMIAAALWLAPLMSEPVMALAFGVLLGGTVQLAFQFPALMRLGLMPRLEIGLNDPRVRKVVGLMGPSLFAVSVTQLNLLLDTLMASFLTTGSVSWLYYSDRLVEFPVGVFGLAVATVILPALSKNHGASDGVAFSRALDWGLRLVLLIGLPATAGLVLLAEPLLAALFQYNEFGAADVRMAAQSLTAYAVGLLGFILIKILAPGFTARQDLRTPVRCGLYAVGVNAGLSLALVFPLAHAGLALGTSLAALANAWLLLAALMRERVYRPEAGWGAFLLRILLGCLVMGALLQLGMDTESWRERDMAGRILHLLLWVAVGVLVYGLALFALGLRPRHFEMEQ